MINDFFEKVYVVSLSRATDRRSYITDLLSSEDINFEFFEAFDGQESFLTEDSLESFVSENFWKDPGGWSPSRGQIGCWMSHVNIWKKMVEDDIGSCLILEDDVTFGVENPNETFRAYLESLPKDWNIFMLGFCNYNGFQNLNENIVKPRIPACTHAYSLKKKSAEILLDHYHPMRGALDMFTGHIFFANEDESSSNLYKELHEGESWSRQRNFQSLKDLHSYACHPAIFNQGGSNYSSTQ